MLPAPANTGLEVDRPLNKRFVIDLYERIADIIGLRVRTLGGETKTIKSVVFDDGTSVSAAD